MSPFTRRFCVAAVVAACAAWQQVAHAGAIAVTPVNLKVNGVVQNIGKIDASLDGNTMAATFTLDKAWAGLTMCTEFHWLQVVTNLVAAPGNPQYNMMALTIPIIDTPSGGYDGQAGEDDLPWYLTAADIANNMLNGTDGAGNKFYKTSDVPSVTGAAFDTWIVAATAAKEFCVIAGFEWGSGTLGGMATLQAKNMNGFPTAANVATINTALTNGAFAGWSAMRDCNIVCEIPEPSSVGLTVLACGAFGLVRRRRGARDRTPLCVAA